jgi:hypothetical protein
MTPPGDTGLDAAVALLLFRRPEETARVFERIRDARPRQLFLIADGPRRGNEEDARGCEQARAVVERVDWPCDVIRDYAGENLGLKRRIPSGLDRVFEEAGEAIVLEDDCLPHPSFFPYCRELLDRYRDDERIVHIAGSQLLQRPPAQASYHFSRYVHVWGWASWRRAWDLYDVELSDWHADSEAERGGRLREMFEEPDERRYWGWVWDHSGEIDNWDAQWSYVGLTHGLSVNPNRNLISNVGFSADATNATADPLGIAARPLDGMEFPLEHPPDVSRDEEADALASGFFRRPAPPLWHRLAGRLRGMRSGSGR